MKVKIWILVLLFLSVSCRKEEKLLLVKLETLKESKGKILVEYKKTGMERDTLVYLQNYLRNLSTVSELVAAMAKSSKKSKRIRKKIEKVDITKLCSGLLIDYKITENMKKGCFEGPFNICPLDFNQYREVSNALANNIKLVLKDELYKKTDCLRFLTHGDI